MEYDERKTKPDSTRKFLIQQVQEQSPLCDVVVKMGYWEKRFHRCVIVASPFFDHVLNDNFLEKQTGKIEMSIGTPDSLEKAIMFLYGKKPNFKKENIENILHMAEFLLIRNLKSACIAWLKLQAITEENCLNFLQLSSIYDFEIPKCTNYIEEHLSEMLLNPQMVNLTKDSIHLLFSDKRLSYVSTDDKVSFLLKWCDAKPDARKIHIQELLTDLDFRELSQPLLLELKQIREFADLIKFEQLPLDQSSLQHVLIMNSGYNDGTFWCLDFDRNQWFRIKSGTFNEERSYRYKDISGTFPKSSESVIWFTDKRYQHASILMLDLAVDTCSKINVKESDERFKLEHINDLQISRDICVASVNEQIKTRKKSDHSIASFHRGLQEQLHLMSLIGCTSFDQLNEMMLMENETMSFVYIKTSTLYIGQIDNGNDNIEMSPLLSFKGNEIFQYTIGQNAIAFIFTSRKCLTIYDLNECNIEEIQQPIQYNDKLDQFTDGFVIYNDKRCLFFTRLSGPCLSNKYEVAEVPLAHKDFKCSSIRYFICGQMLYRYYRKNYDNFIFENIALQTMRYWKPEEHIQWNPLPLPKDEKLCSSNTIKERCFEIRLPRSKLRCNIECPHCLKATSTSINRHYDYNDYDDYVYGDSSDDDYHVPYYYDSSDHYYIDSD